MNTSYCATIFILYAKTPVAAFMGASCAAKLCNMVLTRTVVGFMASPGDFSTQLDVMACLVTGGSICSQSKHASSKTSEVSHLVFQQSALPLGDVRQAPARLSDEVGLDGLQKDTISNQSSFGKVQRTKLSCVLAVFAQYCLCS